MPHSLHSLAVLVINLGSEMIYVLHQRLGAQKVAEDRARRVIREIVSTIFSEKLVDEIFRPQPLYSIESCRAVFDKLAHSSIMRLNSQSMSKLYDLMSMAVKQQILLARCPVEAVLHVLLNHVETVAAMVRSDSEAKEAQVLVQAVHDRIVTVYGTMPDQELNAIRLDLLGFFQDTKVRVSLFLEDGTQRSDGHMVLRGGGGPLPNHIEPPGLIRIYSPKGERSVSHFDYSPNEGEAAMVSTEGPMGRVDSKARVTKLGTNMYTKPRAEKKGANLSTKRDERGERERESQYVPSPERTRETVRSLDLLSEIVFSNKSKNNREEDGDEFVMDMEMGDVFTGLSIREDHISSVESDRRGDHVRIDGRNNNGKNKLMSLMDDDTPTKAQSKGNRSQDDDLLSLLDN